MIARVATLTICRVARLELTFVVLHQTEGGRRYDPIAQYGKRGYRTLCAGGHNEVERVFMDCIPAGTSFPNCSEK